MTTYYIDYNRGDDASADPTNQNTPWKELTKIKTISATAGDQFLLADDSEWSYTMSQVPVTGINWTGTEDNPVIIGKYSPSGTPSSAKPVIRWGNDIQANEWTYSAPNNAWSYSPGLGTLHRMCLVLLGGGWGASKRLDDDTFPLPSVDGVFNVVTSVFWIYAPAGTNPTDYYGGVRISGRSGGGCFNFGYNARGVTVRDIRYEESGALVHVFNGGGAANAYITVDNCEGYKVSAMVQLLAALDDTISLTVKNCTVREWGANAIWLYTQGYRMVNFQSHDNTFIDGNYTFAQGSHYIQARFKKCDIYNNYIAYARYGGYANVYDGCGLYVENNCDNVNVFNNEIAYCYIGIQEGSGGKSRYRNNYIHHCKLGATISTVGDSTDFDQVWENNTFITGYNIVPLNGSKPGVGIYHYHTGADVLLSEIIRNNIFVDVGETDDTTQSAILLRDGFTAAATDYENNLVYGYTNAVARYPSLTPEAAPAGTVTTDPDLDTGGHPQTGSPAIAAGKHSGYRCDRRRTQFWNPPSIGAYEYVPARTSRL